MAFNQKVSAYFLDTFEKAGFDFVRYSEIDMRGTPKETADDILNILITEGEVVRVTGRKCTRWPDIWKRRRRRLKRIWQKIR